MIHQGRLDRPCHRLLNCNEHEPITFLIWMKVKKASSHDQGKTMAINAVMENTAWMQVKTHL